MNCQKIQSVQQLVEPCIVVVDYKSNFVKAEPLKENTAEAVAKVLYKLLH